MRLRLHRPTRLALDLLVLVIVSLNSGCKPLEDGELGEFAHDLFLNALAAFLL